MNIKLILINSSFIIVIAAFLGTVGKGMQFGAALTVVSCVFILAAYILQIVNSISQKKLWVYDNLLYTIAIGVSAVIILHGFSVSIGMPLLGNIPGFNYVYLSSGLLLISLFLTVSIRYIHQINNNKQRLLLVTLVSLSSGISALGLLGISGILPFQGRFISYGLLLVASFYLIYFLILLTTPDKNNRQEPLTLVIFGALMLIFVIVRFYYPQLLPRGLANSVVSFGFVPIIILPLSMIFIRRFHFFTVFLLYFILLDVYFIHADKNFNYLVKVGVDGCVGYDDATTYPINRDPGVAIEELLMEPSKDEVEDILNEWKEKDFTPGKIQIEFVEVKPNGDSIKVVSHRVNGLIHYGLIRIPNGITIAEAPILLGLMGGGTEMDVLKSSDIYRLSNGRCQGVLDSYISIMPTFRGNALRGDGYCFRSEGYSGDVWMGAAEDAVAFLEAVKFMYNKSDDTKTLASGISRGATVALIIGGLTDKLDYIIATSTHTNFLDQYVLHNERVGGSYRKAFYTPKASPTEIRKRILTSSPFYFATNLPPFEIHQGTEDQKTTIWHANMLENRLREIGIEDSRYTLHLYEGKGHAYDDDEIVCASLSKFSYR